MTILSRHRAIQQAAAQLQVHAGVPIVAGRLRENNRAGNSHLPIRRRERQQQLFKSQASAQRFLTTNTAIYKTFYTQRHLITHPTLRRFRAEAEAAWVAAAA